MSILFKDGNKSNIAGICLQDKFTSGRVKLRLNQHWGSCKFPLEYGRRILTFYGPVVDDTILSEIMQWTCYVNKVAYICVL